MFRDSGAVARRLLPPEDIMQIPYDLEFVENRPIVRAIAIQQTLRGARFGRQEDGFDVLLRWVHRLLQRFEKP